MLASAAFETDDKCLNGDNPLFQGLLNWNVRVAKRPQSVSTKLIAHVNKRLEMQYASTADGERSQVPCEGKPSKLEGSDPGCMFPISLQSGGEIPVENKILPVALSRPKLIPQMQPHRYYSLTLLKKPCKCLTCPSV